MPSIKKRGNTYYIQHYVAGKQKRISLNTSSLQIAKERLRQFESAQFRGENLPLPTRTPLPGILQAYIESMTIRKTGNSVTKDSYYLRDIFGQVCPALESLGQKRRPRKMQQFDKRKADPVIEAAYLEDIATADVSAFIAAQVARRGLAPKTANRYREILHSLFQWAIDERGVRMPGTFNPVAKVKRYKERAPQIRYLTLAQIDEQLHALRFKPQLQAMVAVLIYAGLRREELLWLTPADVSLPRPGSGKPPMLRIQAKTVDGESWQPKTGINRAVPISQALRVYLDRWQPAKDATWYFPSPQGKRWDTDNFSRDLRAANAAAGLQWSCLDYRHTFGSHSLNAASAYIRSLP